MKKIILMLLLAVFTASTYAQETKEEKAKRILNIQEPKQKPPVRVISEKEKASNAKRILNVNEPKQKPPVRVLSEKQKQRKAERILNVDNKKDKSFFDKEKKRKHNNGKHRGHYKHHKRSK